MNEPDFGRDNQKRDSVPSHSEIRTTLDEEQHLYILKRLQFEHLVSLDELPITVSLMINKIQSLQVDEAVQILKNFVKDHDDDVNISSDEFDFVVRLIKRSELSNEKSQTADEDIFNWELQAQTEAGIIAFWSPYPEVRSVTQPYDDPSTPVETLRVYIVGVIWTGIGAFVNQFFEERMPSIYLSTSVVQLFIYPSGMLLSWILPKRKLAFGKFSVELNPGPWNYKEQMLATIIFASGGKISYVSTSIFNQKLDVFYGNKWVGWGYESLLALSNNLMGFGFAGIMRRFVVYPAEAVWPSILPTIALNRALLMPEKKENINGWTISRYYFFFGVTAYSFIYFWIPDYLFQALSQFNWMTWIKPDNFNLAAITGSISGLGLNPIPSFDWNVLNNNSFATPFYSTALQYAGSIIAFAAIVATYYTNSNWTGYLPINSNHVFTNTGKRYDINKILTKNSLFDETAYQEYSPTFYSAGSLVFYGAYFVVYPFLIVYEIGSRYKSLLRTVKSGVYIWRKGSSLDSFQDSHSRMMTNYKEVPEWIFLVILVLSIVLAIICVKIYPAETPVWGIFFALGLNLLFLIPIFTLHARTGYVIGLNVLLELIVGYAIPGNGLALNFIKCFGYNIDSQAESYVQSQKWGHYIQIPPWSLFRGQILATFICSFVNLAVVNFEIDHIVGFCTPLQKQKLSCPGSNSFFSASVLWGVIGPKKVFGGLYPILQWCFLIGFVATIPSIAFKLYGPKKLTKYFEPTVFIGGMTIFAPYNLTYHTGGLYLSILFMWYLKSRYLAWWEKYNYVFAGGLEAGIAFSSVIIFFAVQYHNKLLKWWGNDVSSAGMDGRGSARLNATLVTENGYFGPRKGHFP